MSNYIKEKEEVICERCGEHPKTVYMDNTYDYDGNDRVHTYGRYWCSCGYSSSFPTNDPYENEKDYD